MDEITRVTSNAEAVGDRIRAELRKAVVGQDEVIEQVLVALLADGHILIEGVPGVAKTLMVRALAMTLNLSFTRVQFTPDLMPSDIIGTNVYDAPTHTFQLRKGPVFTNVLLADEVNRTPPKTQSALLEAMEERRVTVDGEPQVLPNPFFVAATQNPIEFEGTYPLPEAQLDRFLLKVVVDYPEANAERDVLRRYDQGFRALRLEDAGIHAVVSSDELTSLRAEVGRVLVEDKIIDYITEIVRKSRASEYLVVGASPRAGIALLLTSKALAALRGRDFVTPDDVKAMVLPVLRHRVLLRPEAEIEGLSADRVLNGLVDGVAVPR